MDTLPRSFLPIQGELADPVDMAALLKRVVEEEHVAFISGETFRVHAGSQFSRDLRLNSTNYESAMLEIGVESCANRKEQVNRVKWRTEVHSPEA